MRSQCFSIFTLIGLDHSRPLQGLGKKRGHAFHMGLQISRGFALAVANLDDRPHCQRIDANHDKRHQPIKPDHRANQNHNGQTVPNQIIG